MEPIEGGVNDTVIYPSDFKEKTTPSFVNELYDIPSNNKFGSKKQKERRR